jgi:hypothetical protein
MDMLYGALTEQGINTYIVPEVNISSYRQPPSSPIAVEC